MDFVTWLRRQQQELLTDNSALTPRRASAAALGAGICAALLRSVRQQRRAMALEVPLSTLMRQVEAGLVQTVTIAAGACAYRLKDERVLRAHLLPSEMRTLVKLMHRNGVEFRAIGPAAWKSAVVLLLPFAYLGLCGWLLWRVNADLNGGNVEVPDAAAATAHHDAITFDDVGGMSAAKAQLMEVVDFFHHPERWARLGARRPRGVLLNGPPGTGKTLLAKAVAGTAGVPFLCCAGSEFVEVFVGRGAKRVRAVFEEATRLAPCVLFIDEIDALGSRRADGGGGGSEEHDHTLNQLLTRMDGIGSSAAVLVIGATNRLAALDPALIRPGRFDRVVTLPHPNEAARFHILSVHARRSALVEPRETVRRVAAETDGLSGAELANLVNEAAIRATRRSAAAVEYEDFANALAEYRSSRAPPVSERGDATGYAAGEGAAWALPVAAMLSQLAQGAAPSSVSSMD